MGGFASLAFHILRHNTYGMLLPNVTRVGEDLVSK